MKKLGALKVFPTSRLRSTVIPAGELAAILLLRSATLYYDVLAEVMGPELWYAQSPRRRHRPWTGGRSRYRTSETGVLSMTTVAAEGALLLDCRLRWGPEDVWALQARLVLAVTS